MDMGFKIPRGLDTSLILDGPRKRRGGTHGSPEPVLSTRSGRAGVADIANQVATDAAGFEEIRKRGMILWDKLTAQTDHYDSTRFLHSEFMRLPSRVDFPDYYNLIKKPVSFGEIKARLDKLEYSSLYEIRVDFNQCFVNAKRYNARNSTIFNDAKKLHKTLKETYALITGEAYNPDEDDNPAAANGGRQESQPLPDHPSSGSPMYNTSPYPLHPPPLPPLAGPSSHQGTPGPGLNEQAGRRGPTLKPWLTRKLRETMSLTDNMGRNLAEQFRALPDRSAWAEYYRIITHPMAFEIVSSKIAKRTYSAVQQFVDDVSVIFANAQYFNEESSRLWKDAKLMQLHFAEVMKEIPPQFVPPRKYNTAKRRAADAEAIASGGQKRQKFTASESGEPAGGEGGYDDDDDDDEGEDAPPEGYNNNGMGYGAGDPYTAAPFDLPLPPPKLEDMGTPFDAFGNNNNGQGGGMDLDPRSRSRTPAAVGGAFGGQQQQDGLQPINSTYGGYPVVDMSLGATATGGALGLDSSAMGMSNINPALAGMGGSGRGFGEENLSSSSFAPRMNGFSGTNGWSGGADVGGKPLVAKLPPSKGESHVAHFLVSTTPASPTTTLTLSNALVRQHSFAIPSTTSYISVTPILTSSLLNPSKGKERADPNDIDISAPTIRISVRPMGTTFESQWIDQSTTRYDVGAQRGVTIVEFVVVKPGEEEVGNQEVYRVYVTK